MDITFAPRGILQIDDAMITYRNFSGAPSTYNRAGDRNYHLIIEPRDLTPDEVKNFMDTYRDATIIEREDGPLLMYNGMGIISVADALVALGWNVKVKPPRMEGEAPFIHMKVNVNFNEYGPRVFLVTSGRKNQLSEDTVGCLDRVELIRADMDIRPYDWESKMGSGRSAYLQTMYAVQKDDRFADRYAEEECPSEVPF